MPGIERLSIPTTGYYCFSPGAQPKAPAIFALHGFAQTALDFHDHLRKLIPPEWAVVALQGFHQIPSRRDRSVTFSWMSSYEKADNIARNHDFLNKVQDSLVEKGTIDPHRTVVLGFSQGSSVAYRWAQAHPDRVGGIVSICADLPPDVAADLDPISRLPVFLLYAEQDRFFPVAIPEQAVQALAHANVRVRSIRFEGDHRVPSILASELPSWLNEHSL
jgi:predicted esterase